MEEKPVRTGLPCLNMPVKHLGMRVAICGWLRDGFKVLNVSGLPSLKLGGLDTMLNNDGKEQQK